MNEIANYVAMCSKFLECVRVGNLGSMQVVYQIIHVNRIVVDVH